MNAFCIQCSKCGWTAPFTNELLKELEGKETFRCPGCGLVGRVRP